MAVKSSKLGDKGGCRRPDGIGVIRGRGIIKGREWTDDRIPGGTNGREDTEV
jgi:hypothetical protein